MDLIHLKQTIETYRNEADQAYLDHYNSENGTNYKLDWKFDEVRRVGFNPQIKERRVT